MRRNFTLIELLVVIVLAMTMLLLGASAYSKISGDNALNLAAGMVKGAFERARSNAIKTRKMTWVYFLDGDGDLFSGKLSSESQPYEVLVAQDDGAGGFIEISRAQLPLEIAWLAPPVKDQSGNLVRAIKGNRQGLGVLITDRDLIPDDRHCGLIYSFNYKGRAYRSSVGRNDERYELRLVNIDQLAANSDVSSEAANALFVRSLTFELKHEGVVIPTGKGTRFEFDTSPVSYDNRRLTPRTTPQQDHKHPGGCVVTNCLGNIGSAEDRQARKINWRTISMDSYATGLVKDKRGIDEENLDFCEYAGD